MNVSEYVSELVINYQELLILENMTTVSWFLNDTFSESFEVRGYTLNTGEPVLSPDHVFTVGKSISSVAIEHTNTNSDISYKLVAYYDENVCPSTRDIYYRFDGMLPNVTNSFSAV